MENLHVKNIRRWVFLLAIFTGFSIQTGIANELLSIRDISATQLRGVAPVTFTFGCLNGEPGDTICVPVTVENFTDIVIAQFEIFWNSSVLDYIGISNPGSPSINVNADFNLSGPNALKFIPLGFPIAGESLPDGTVLFEICFRVIGIPGATSHVGISPYFDFEVADVNGVIPSDSINCSMTVDNAVTLVGFVTSCGPAVLGGNGTIDVTAYGGTAPYDITWNGAASGGPINIPVDGGSNSMNVPAGNYDVTITDALGNSVIYNVDVATVALSIITHLKDPTCYKFDNGTIWIKPQGGTEPYSYIWQSLDIPNLAGSGFIRNLGDSSLVTSLPDGNYSILVKDDNGCEVQITVTLNDNPFIININSVFNSSCVGSADGLINLSISGATPDASGNYTITIKPGFQISNNMVSIGLLDPGQHSITISDNVSQCDTVFTFNIGYTDTITATVNVTNPPCATGSNGSVTMRGRTNGVPGPSYTYNIYENGNLITTAGPVGGNFNYSPLGPGNYVAIVEEGACHSDSIYFSITAPPPIVAVELGSTLDNCRPTGSGDIWFSITGGTGPYILDSDEGFQDADTLFNLNSGNHTLTVTDALGCKGTLPFVIHSFDENEEADITFVIDGTPCDGGTVAVLYQGLPIPLNVGVSWSTGQVNDTITITGTDTLSVDLIFGAPIFCILSDTVQIHCTQQLELDITVVQPLCGEGAEGGPYTGTVIVDTTNAVEPVTWIWSFPDTTMTGIYSGLAPGKYYVTVTDALDSVAVDSFEIIAPNTLTLMFSNVDSVSCPEMCDGGVRVIPANGDPLADYQLYWDPINPMADTGLFFNITNLCAGLNVFTVSQDGICFYKDTIEIFAPDSVKIDLVSTKDVTCFGGNDGMIEILASGGTPGYTYDWLGGPSTPVYNGVNTDVQYVTVTDSKNCSQIDSFFVSEPDTLIADIDLTITSSLSCGNSSDGVIAVDVNGGNAGGYTYTWNPNVSATYQAVNLTAGQYSITVTDPKGCTDTASYTLVAPLPLVVTWPIVATPACSGDETELLIEDVTGGSGNYNYTINGGQIMNIGDPVLLPAGIYIVDVFDDKGCSTDTTYIIVEPDPILVSIGPDNPVINLGDSLFIEGTVDQSGNPIAMTLWTSTEPVSCQTCPGTWVFNSLPTVYTWTVTDVNGCEATASITVDVDYARDVYIPNIFSPNDDGRNDHFSVFTGLGVVSINYIRIYDRWGNLVHNEENLTPNPAGAGDWDGYYKGDPLNPGVFAYLVSVTFIDDNTTLVYKGDVTIVK